MKVGVTLDCPIEETAEFASAAEAVGAESLWISDHLVWPVHYGATYPYSASGRPPVGQRPNSADVWSVLSAAAAVTSTIRLGTSVYLLALRSPLVAARSIVTLDLLSNGRAVLGVGAGWMREEFAIAGIGFESRGSRLDEMINLLRRLWADDIVEFSGEHISLEPVYFDPKPRQGSSLPILVGGESAAALRRAALLGDGWIGMSHSAATARAVLERLEAARLAVGRAEDVFEVTLGVRWPLDMDEVWALDNMGVNRVIVRPWRRSESWRAGIETLAGYIKALSADGSLTGT